jgi:hypothetical protein
MTSTRFLAVAFLSPLPFPDILFQPIQPYPSVFSEYRRSFPEEKQLSASRPSIYLSLRKLGAQLSTSHKPSRRDAKTQAQLCLSRYQMRRNKQLLIMQWSWAKWHSVTADTTLLLQLWLNEMLWHQLWQTRLSPVLKLITCIRLHI